MLEQEVALSLRNVTVNYGGVCAVDDVSFDLRKGTIVGLIGPNGAGKTSLIDAITGYAAASGDVVIGSTNLRGVRAHKRARRGLVRTFQGAELFDDLTLEQNLVLGSFLGSVKGVFADLRRLGSPAVPAVVEELLDVLELTDVRHDLVTRLPVGRQKLVTVARAMAANPQVLLLDEPAAGLDSNESRAFGATLRSLSRFAPTTLLVDHDMDLVLSVCDQVHVLEFGKLIASGTPEEIRRDPVVIAAYLGVGAA